MPNYCYSFVRSERINEEAKEKFRFLCKRLGENRNFSELMQDGTIDEDEMFTRSWQHDHIGPKWTHIEDLDEEDCTLSLTSAWSAPDDGVQWLVSQLAEVDDKLITVYTYREEQPDFAGCYVFLGEETYDGYEDDYEDIKYLVEDRVEELSEMKDEDGDYTEEGWEVFHENIFEVIDDCEYTFSTEVIDQIYAEEAEAEKEEVA